MSPNDHLETIIITRVNFGLLVLLYAFVAWRECSKGSFMNPLVAIIVLVVCGVRFTIAPGLDKADIYKDLAHIFVGSLLGDWLMAWHAADGLMRTGSAATHLRHLTRVYGYAALGITLLEVACGLFGKFTGKSVVGFLFG